jgi:DNA-binding MarR family transcriptional regulator
MIPTSVLRRFNRTWTQRIGALDESFLGMGWPLGASRLIFEIGTGPAAVRELRERLDLDSGYLSRLLRRLEDADVVAVQPDPADGRRRLVRLTATGRTAYDELERRSEAKAQALVAPLSERQQARLAEALATADLLVRAATVRLRRTSTDDPVAQAAVGRYYDELAARFPDGFEAGPTSLADGVFVVATSDGEPVACGGVQPLGTMDGHPTGEVKRMWVHPGWRGAGLGARMLRHLEDVASELGHTRVVLDTSDRLTEAVAMYERAGYASVPAYNDNPYARVWFSKGL